MDIDVKKFYYVREDKTVAFIDDPNNLPFYAPEAVNSKEVTNEEFVIGEDGYCYLKEDLNSPEYIHKIEDMHKTDELFTAHQFLINTDYIIIKLYEAQVNGDLELMNQLKIKYASQLEQRKQIRNRINELENA